MSHQAQEVEQLSRRVAIEVMGKEEPANPKRLSRPDPLYAHFRDINDAWIEHYGPEGREVLPKPFSCRLDLSLRAVDKAFADYLKEYSPELAPVIVLQHPTADWEWLARIVEGVTPEKRPSSQGFGDTAPEAICRCLLEFVAQERPHAKEGQK